MQVIKDLIAYVDDYELWTSEENQTFTASTQEILKLSVKNHVTHYGRLIQGYEIAETYNWFSGLCFLIGKLSETTQEKTRHSNAPYLRELTLIISVLINYKEVSSCIVEDALRKWNHKKEDSNVNKVISKETSDIFDTISTRWIVELERIAAKNNFTENTIPQKPPLGEIAGLIYEKLKSLPEHKAMTLPKISEWLAVDKKIIVDETTIRTKHLPQLDPYGLYHKKRIGYCLR